MSTAADLQSPGVEAPTMAPRTIFLETKGSIMMGSEDLQQDPVGDLHGVEDEVDFEVDLHPDLCGADLEASLVHHQE